jgi:hypothetical protein
MPSAQASEAIQPRADCVTVPIAYGHAVSINRVEDALKVDWPAITGADSYTVQTIYRRYSGTEDAYQYSYVTLPHAVVTLSAPSDSTSVEVYVYGYRGTTRLSLCGEPGWPATAALKSPALPIGDPIPKDVKASFSSAFEILVDWKPPSGADSWLNQPTYIVSSNPSGLSCTTKPGEYLCSVTNPHPDTTYTFTVSTVSDIGISSPSAPSAAVRWVAPPSDPTSVKIQTNTTNAAFSWKPAKTGPKATSFVVESIPRTNVCHTKTTSCTVKGLKPGKTYAFAITSTGADGGESYIYTKPVKTPMKNLVVKKFVAVVTTKVKPNAVLS